jgi:hypothetical protein
VRECIVVDELDCPVQEADDTAKAAKHNATDDISLCSFLLLRY